MTLKITIFSFDIPYPPNRGGRADVWRRINVLKSLGCEIQLICWNAMRQDVIDYKTISTVVDDLVIFNLSSGFEGLLRRLIFLPWYPSHVSSRVVDDNGLPNLERKIAKFSPQAFWVEGVFPTLYLKKMLARFKIPYFYRSHNVEHTYMRSQADVARGLSKLSLFFSTLGLERYEKSLITHANRAFDASFDDAEFWKSQGMNNVEVLTPMPESALLSQENLEHIRQSEKNIEVLFLGNLATPNNVKGVLLLVNEILPLVKLQIPDVEFVIAGSNPVKAVLEVCESNPNVKLMANVQDPFKMMCQSRVLVNPIATGGGVMVKMLDMLMTNQPIVTMPQGLYGLPTGAKDAVSVATSVSEFASQVVEFLNHECEVDLMSRDQARRNFSQGKIKELIDLIVKETSK